MCVVSSGSPLIFCVRRQRLVGKGEQRSQSFQGYFLRSPGLWERLQDGGPETKAAYPPQALFVFLQNLFLTFLSLGTLRLLLLFH